MIHAYDKNYLERTRTSLGRMLDFAVYDLKYSLSDFWNLFLLSNVSKRIEIGDTTVLSGMSGIELAYEVLNDKDGSTKPEFTLNRSAEYWTGWAIAYFEWQTSMPFKEITRYISIDEICGMYFPYHEMDIRQFTLKLLELYRMRKGETNLKRKRTESGLSQNELALESGVPLRTIQQYEQGQKNINNAKAECVLALSRVLCCDMSSILEY